MKKQLKILFIFLFILVCGTLLSKQVKATETNASVKYGTLTNGKCEVTVTFSQDLADTSWTNWTISGKTAKSTMSAGQTAFLTKTFTDGTVEVAIIAVPIELEKGSNITLNATGSMSLSDIKVTDTSIATASDKKITAVKVGNTTITGKATVDGNQYDCTWKLAVTDSSSGGGSGSTTDLTDFSNAKYSWSEDTNDPKLIVSNVTIKSDHNYQYAITSSASTTPQEGTEYLSKNGENLKSFNGLGTYISLNQDIYLWIYDNDELVVKGVKIEKPEIPTGIKAFNSNCTLASSSISKSTIITLMYPFGDFAENGRKMNIKIGKISDSSLLKSLKENPNTEELLKYAKTSEGIYNNTLTANNFSGYFDKSGILSIDSSKIEHDAYYFLYVELDDENGKYIVAESATFVQAHKYDSGDWFLFFYGSGDFKWSDVTNSQDDGKKDDEAQVPTKIPKAGENIIFVSVISVLIISGIIYYVRLRKMKY